MLDLKMLQAAMMIEYAIAEYLAENGDLDPFKAADEADLAYFDHEIVQFVMKEQG